MRSIKKTIDATKSRLSTSDIVLDFACASGKISLDLAQYVEHLYGIDVSSNMIELANQKAVNRRVGNVKFDQIDVFDQRLMYQSYAVVLAFNIFHLVEDCPGILARLKDLLLPDGLLISQTPCLGEWRFPKRSLVNLAQTLGLAPRIQGLKFAELETLIAAEGFEIIENATWDQKNRIQRVVARKQ